MAKFLLVLGHGENDPGAVFLGRNERDWNRNTLLPSLKKWAGKLKNNTVDFYDPKFDMYQESQRGRGAYTVSNSYKSVTEFHEDAAGASATGGHVIISSKFNADSDDLAIASVVKKYAGWWAGVANKQGINKRNDLFNLNVFSDRGISYRLVELGFITNENDMRKLENNIDSLAKDLIGSITGEKFDSKPVEPSKPSEPANKRPRQKIETYWYGKESPKYKQMKKYLKDNTLKHTESVGTDGRIKIIISSFNQDSDSKYKLEKYLSANDMNFIVDIA